MREGGTRRRRGKARLSKDRQQLVHAGDRRGRLDAPLLPLGAERLEGQAVPAEPACDRAALDQRDLGAPERDHHLRQGE
jgi:hypothetical protein